jgi:orotate phosphoribosyltransferase
MLTSPGVRSDQTVLDLLARSGALLEGHFLLSSGLHSPHYIQCARMLESPGRAEIAGRFLADLAKDLRPDVVVGPALGGIVIAHETARALDTRCLFTERQGGVMALRRGFDLRPGEKVLIVEDVVTTGKSTREVRDVVEDVGARVVGYAAIVNRSGGERLFGMPLLGQTRVDLTTYEPADCPLCAEGSEPSKPGSREA